MNNQRWYHIEKLNRTKAFVFTFLIHIVAFGAIVYGSEASSIIEKTGIITLWQNEMPQEESITSESKYNKKGKKSKDFDRP